MNHARQTLNVKLDECLLASFDALKQRESVGIADLYHLQSLCEAHYYLKVEHSYTPADLEALLQFRDPLSVAQAAKEENTRDYTFPIAEILKEIGAYQTFELSTPHKAKPHRPRDDAR